MDRSLVGRWGHATPSSRGGSLRGATAEWLAPDRGTGPIPNRDQQHSQRKRGAPDRPDQRKTAPALDPTLGEPPAREAPTRQEDTVIRISDGIYEERQVAAGTLDAARR